MVTQVIFKIDSQLKELAMKKAQTMGLPFASVLKLATQAFVSGQLKVGLVDAGGFNTTTSQELKSALKDIKNKKNLSAGFKSAKSAMPFLSR